MDRQISGLINDISMLETVKERQKFINDLPMKKVFYCEECSINNNKCFNNDLSKQSSQPQCKANKVLLTSLRHCDDKSVNLIDSIVFDLEKCKLLSSFPKRVIKYGDLSNDVKKSNKFSNFKVKRLVNGTMYVIYYDNDKMNWIIHTKNHSNANNIIIYNNKSNYDIVANQINFDILDKDNCYTFIITDPDIHIIEEYRDVIFVQYMNVNTFELVYKLHGFRNMKDFNKLANTAVSNLISNCSISISNYKNTGHKFYGYLLELDNNKCNIMIESTIMIKLRTIFYNNIRNFSKLYPNNDINDNNDGDNIDVSSYNEKREKFLSLNVYCSSQTEQNKPLLKLFKCYEQKFIYYDKFYDELVTDIIKSKVGKNTMVDNFIIKLNGEITFNEENRSVISNIIKSFTYIPEIIDFIE